jgi:casein kinase 1
MGKKIGSGSFGEIYLGLNMHTNREVAVKFEQLNVRRP